jgi:hypothetical protein
MALLSSHHMQALNVLRLKLIREVILGLATAKDVFLNGRNNAMKNFYSTFGYNDV